MEGERAGATSGGVRGPQSLVSGIVLMLLAVFALYLTRDLPQGTLRAMGPAMLPRWLAIGVGGCGLLLAIIGLTKDGHRLESFSFRGPIVVTISICLFAVTIRGFPLGILDVPGLGLLVAGPLCIFVSGLASPEARWRELAMLALSLTAFCMMLFGDLLNLPIPMYPQWFADLYPAGWSNDGRLRMTSLVLVLLAVAIWWAGRGRGQDAPVDVADHQVEAGGRGRI